MSKILKKSFVPISLIILLFFSIIFSISVSSVKVEFASVWAIILHSLGFQVPITWTKQEQIIITIIRVPRVLMAVVIGAMLGVAGVAAQGLFKNPIADPYIIGISSAAGFGTALMVVLGIAFFNLLSIPLIAFLFAILSIAIVYKFSQTNFRLSTTALLLSGIAISFFFQRLQVLFYTPLKTNLI